MTAPVLLQPPPVTWECPTCAKRYQTTDPRVATKTHPCPDLGGLSVPLQRADRYGVIGERHHIRPVERGDWIGDEAVAHGGTMAVHAERGDGSHDTVVFAPTAYNRPSDEEQ